MLKIRPLAATPEAALAAALANAPYLRRLSERTEARSFEDALADVTGLPADTPIEDAMRVLRKAKAAVHLSLAADDLSGQRDVMQVTAALTELATASVRAALRVALGSRGLTDTGIFIFALGKMGAFELNYSSDIDIAAFYEPDSFDGGDRTPGETAQRVMRDVVRLLDEITADGYVFRTDLRLRPDPSSTPLAVSTHMADVYYESVGQNWERMVWIKARAAAGDSAAAARFIQRMSHYVWRRNLDYWAIDDIQAIKRMINTKIGAKGLENPAPDIKLGPGGIREIEFFVQTQQLILGGRHPALRDNSTLGAMAALRDAGIVTGGTAEALSVAYKALRNVEHRIQMRHDEQTHTIPADVTEREGVAALCGYDSLADFDRDLLESRQLVQEAYDGLFAHEGQQDDASDIGNLVFTGVDDDPETVRTLDGLGFTDPSRAIGTIRNWHRGNVPATRTVRGRELLTAILPRMLTAMGETGEPDEAFRWFSRFFSGLSSGVQTLSMLLAKPDLLDDLVATLALAPRLAEILSRRPDLLEALVSGDAPVPPRADAATNFDAALDDWRRYHREQSFLIGHRLLHGLINASDAAVHWSRLADETIRQMASAAEVETVRRYGDAPGTWGVFAMGKLGGSELTAGSDLDIIVIYDAPSLEAQSWFTRVTQRLITALTAPTAEGALYEVDMRLRPSGRGGPVAVSLSAFERYQNDEAWTWEHMALTRLRFVAGDAGLGASVLTMAKAAIAARAEKDSGQIAQDVSDMRIRLYKEKPGKGLWDLKTEQGGLIDIEFIVQEAMLMAGRPECIWPNVEDALKGIPDSAAKPDADYGVLEEALAYLQALQQVQRLAIGSDMEADEIPDGLKDRLCRAVGAEDFASLEARLADLKAKVHEIAVRKLHLVATD
ncbi:bifunctional [glutamine synthetase] adenylyltransferase/[glutamine synthetase]-adenylyl-L-tyrosine phosphorylase [Hyphomonas oceanitis]|uniref:Glutamate ammonia ligase adenylyl-transferase n=1 Tax=Hyphomonas oceanitis SCH89 TaxID=1280953 RepID=A0A059G7T9_9PROT|nr:bifunctional [glutamine synthetase] adenylyltransferase/[glutamine synthetase]-adenylyl-L-tyrosine phosphorylase [Hyphomonas oceanitis]KDA02872.1 glutamate ammonia ligase adenylyl-transferase [Hyphomonas oceanitis SCH89]